jgi:hypothetical protein
MKSNKFPVRVRLANELFYDTFEISEKAFTPEREFPDEVFGKLDNLFVAVNREDWEAANKHWQNVTQAD